ncbi:MAG: hypothetical protein PUC32_03315 [Oscillospiraceae bacterium]|nr:hypothetical protein [Oscillospiraceae bacterium]
MTAQQDWLRQNSPYRPHKSRRAQFTCTDCCGQQMQPDGSQIFHHDPVRDTMAWFSLYRCPVCGRYYILLGQKWKWIESPLRYERRSDPDFPKTKEENV